MRDLFAPAGSANTAPRAPRRAAGQGPTTSLKDAIARFQDQSGGVVQTFEYFEADGRLAFVVLRSDKPHGGKEFRQLRPDKCGGFVWKGPGSNRPLYCLPDLLARSDDIVVVVEGEKCAEAVRDLGCLATTASQGSSAPRKTDWSPLAGRSVVIAPDNDDAGRAYAAEVARLCREAGAASVRTMKVPVTLPRGDIADLIDSLRQDQASDDRIRQAIEQLIADSIVENPADAAQEDGESMSPPGFPVSAFPRFCREIVESGARSQGVDVGFWAVPALAILAGCVGASRSISLKADWSEPAILWCLLIAPSGMGKSPGMRALMRPVRDCDKAMHLQNCRAEDHYRHEVAEAKRNKEAPPAPPRLRSFVIDDATMEAVVGRLDDNSRGLLLVNDELVGWLNSFNKYRKNGGDDREKWLRIYDGDAVKVDRKAVNGGPRQVLVESAVISVVGTTQPKIAAECLTGDVQSSGLTARLLIAAPPLTPPTWTDSEIPAEHTDQWRRLVETLLDLSHEAERSTKLSLTPDARQAFIDCFDNVGLRQWAATEDGDEDVAAALGKARGLVARVALILCLARTAENGTAELTREVDELDVRGAIQIVDWFMNEAQRCYDAWGRQGPQARTDLDTRVVKAMLEHRRLTTGQVRDKLHRKYSGADVRASLLRLHNKGQLDCEKRKAGPRGGRPTEEWTYVG